MDLRQVYVTVGTTKFNALIENIMSDKVLKILQTRKCKKLVLQLGNSNVPTKGADEILKNYGIEVEQYTFRPNLADIVNANLVIGHAGAGTCLDILNNGKAGLIVVNDGLMDNHQLELAQQLAAEGYIYYCHVGELAQKLEMLKFDELKPYEKMNNMENFIDSLNALMSAV